MAESATIIRGEYRRLFDDRYRIALPPELAEALGGDNADCVIAKEREGCLSLWTAKRWEGKVEPALRKLQADMDTGWFSHDPNKIQRFIRLLSTRSRPVQLGQRGRLLVPEGFREFLEVPAGSEVAVVGAGLCVEIWHPARWSVYLKEDLVNFNDLFAELFPRAAG